MRTTQSVISRAESLTGPDPGIKFLERFALATGQVLSPAIGGRRTDMSRREGLAECRRLRRLALRMGCRWISAVEPAQGQDFPDVVVRMARWDHPRHDQVVAAFPVAARRTFCAAVTVVDIDTVTGSERRAAIFRRRRNVAAPLAGSQRFCPPDVPTGAPPWIRMNGSLSPDPPRVFTPIAAHLEAITSSVTLPRDVRLECLTGRAIRDELSAAGLQLDYRARLPGAVPTEEGIAFDPRNVRTQTWLLRAGERPAGVMTMVVEPRDWIAKQRFLRLEDGVVALEDCSRFTGGAVPRFAVVAGWTNVLPEFRGKFGRAVGPVLQQLVSATAAAAPRGTWIMIGAAGHVPFEPPGVMAEFATMPLGTQRSMTELPIDPEDFGVAKPESRATVLFSAFLGLHHVPDVADVRTLGPAFVLPASGRTAE